MSNKISELKKKFKQDKASYKKNWKVFITEGKKCISEFKNKETRYKQIPNAFTASRIFAPFFIIPAGLSSNFPLTLIFTLGFGSTDYFDGKYARKYHAQSEFGRELDPITDKIFAGSLLLPLAVLNPIMIGNILLEGVIAAINMHSRLNDNKPRTVITGKVKTVSLYLTILLSYVSMSFAINPTIITSLIAITGGLQIVTAAKYLINYKKDENSKEMKKFFQNYIYDDEENGIIGSQKEKQLVINKSISNEIVKELTIDEKIEKLTDLKRDLVPGVQIEENIKVYEKK